MTGDDEIPERDAVADAARRALDGLSPTPDLSWDAVTRRAGRVRRNRAIVAVVTAVVCVVGLGAVVRASTADGGINVSSMFGSDDDDTTTTTTTVPLSTTTTVSVPTGVPGGAGGPGNPGAEPTTTTTAPPYQNPAQPIANALTGELTFASASFGALDVEATLTLTNASAEPVRLIHTDTTTPMYPSHYAVFVYLDPLDPAYAESSWSFSMVPDDGRDEVVLAPGESIALHDYKFDEPYSTDFTFSGPTRATAVIEWDYHRSRDHAEITGVPSVEVNAISSTVSTTTTVATP